MRELGLWADDDGLDRTFDEIDRLAARCRFPDCGHEREPGCAVRAAVEAGETRRRAVGELPEAEARAAVSRAQEGREEPAADTRRAAGRDFAARLKEVKKNKLRYR
ncbi:MAG: hypothetical protein M0C28_47620 [Candidatus Moduliflexus flocculans]|nr:hypothetical protein [Candidatus Moduliflexus flocculans]